MSPVYLAALVPASFSTLSLFKTPPARSLSDMSSPIQSSDSPEIYRIPRKPVTSNTAPRTEFPLNSYASIKPGPAYDNRIVPGLGSHERLIREHSPPSNDERYVKWGIAWRTPFFMVLRCLLDFVLHLDIIFTIDPSIQQRLAPHLDETGLCNSEQHSHFWLLQVSEQLAMLHTSSIYGHCSSARHSLWMRVDRLISVTSVPTSFMSLEFVKMGKVAFLVALVCWSLVIFSLVAYCFTIADKCLGVFPWWVSLLPLRFQSSQD